MTKDMCISKIKFLLENNGIESLFDRCESLINSGGVDVSGAADNDFTVPKLILIVALMDLADSFMPYGVNHGLTEKKVKDLRRF